MGAAEAALPTEGDGLATIRRRRRRTARKLRVPVGADCPSIVDVNSATPRRKHATRMRTTLVASHTALPAACTDAMCSLINT